MHTDTPATPFKLVSIMYYLGLVGDVDMSPLQLLQAWPDLHFMRLAVRLWWMLCVWIDVYSVWHNAARILLVTFDQNHPYKGTLTSEIERGVMPFTPQSSSGFHASKEATLHEDSIACLQCTLVFATEYSYSTRLIALTICLLLYIFFYFSVSPILACFVARATVQCAAIWENTEAVQTCKLIVPYCTKMPFVLDQMWMDFERTACIFLKCSWQ